MCGIIGIVGKTPVSQQIFDGLTVQQHRGQDAAGMATEHEGQLILRKHNGLVREVFRTRHMRKLQGTVGIGHVRYPTAGTPSSSEAQPFYVNSPYGIALAHNGNLINTKKLKTQLFFQDQRHINTDSDSEILLNVFAQELSNRNRVTIKPSDIFDAVCRVYDRCEGAYAAVAMIVGHGIVAFRDVHGIRPLVYGAKELNDGSVEYCVASESVALDALGFEAIRNIAPGEAIYITNDGEVHSFQCVEPRLITHTPCIFEYVYLARPDSRMDGVYVHKARMRMGKYLAKTIKQVIPNYKKKIDIVVPVPSTSRSIALEIAKTLKIQYRDGFVKNRYVGRTFIMPDQEERKKSVRVKLNALDVEFKKKNVLLVDDSIVRGTTSKEIIEMVRKAGAKKVYFASAAPPVRYPNVYGIDMPVVEELIAHGRSAEEVSQEIGADMVIYQKLDNLIRSITVGNPDLTSFDCSVFDGKYITGVPDNYFADLATERNNAAKTQRSNLILDDDDDE
jgi:amidophosphoribosyltransferase